MPNQSLLRLLDAMDRRTLLGRGAAVMGGLFAGLSLRPGKAYGQARPTAASPGRNNTWNVVVAGEAMVSRPFATHDEPEFLSICEILRESDITYAHCEMNFSEFEELPWTPKAGGGGGSTMIAEPQVAKDLKWMGIDMVSLAHNHAADWGAPGVLSTIQACKQAGIACAGTGRDLEDARSPVFLEQKKGRVALIALNTGPSGAAGLAKGSIPGRPGQNFLRITTKYEVDHSTAEQLKASAKKLGVLRVSSRAPQEFNINPTSDFAYIDGNKFEISTVNDPKDLEGNLRSIRAAREMADFVMVAQHCSASEGERGDVPTKAARAFAMAAIDAGADIYIGHGWHWTLGIEIYKNKPLIYGTGNFFDQNEYIQRVPADAYEGHGYDIDKLTTLTPAEYPLHPAGDERWWHSSVLQLKFENNKLTEIRLHPVELGWDITGEKPVRTRWIGTEHPKTDGRPLMASGAQAQKILQRIQRLSAAYGTKIEIQDGIGIARISEASSELSRRVPNSSTMGKPAAAAP